MNTIFKMTICALALTMAPSWVGAQDGKKEKKKAEWKMPEKLSGNAIIDTYLLSCDTLNTRVQEYNENITYYRVVAIETVDDNGQPVLNEDGTRKKEVQIVDDNNVVRNSAQVWQQYTDWILTGTSITADCVSIAAQTISATAELPKLGLGALTYAKYVKAGPNIIAKAGTEVKEIVASIKEQRASIRAYKKAYSESGELLDPSIDPSNIDGVNLADIPVVAKSTKDLYAEREAAKQAGSGIEVNLDEI